MTSSDIFTSVKQQSIWVVLAAAGIGSRTGLNIPKQYLPIEKYPVICHVLSELLECSLIAGVMVVVAKNDEYWPQVYSAYSNNSKKLRYCLGGAQRSDSVLAGLKALSETVEADDWILVHDAARPGCTSKDLTSLIQQLDIQDNMDGLIPCIESTDTLKQVNEKGIVEKTLERSKIWRAQTPQCFRFNQLLGALQNSQAVPLITDESSAMEAAGFLTQVIPGRDYNFKITTLDDLQRMKQVISKLQNAEKRAPLEKYFSPISALRIMGINEQLE